MKQYFPVLKHKLGETTALSNLENIIMNSINPIFLIEFENTIELKKLIKKINNKLPANLANSYGIRLSKKNNANLADDEKAYISTLQCKPIIIDSNYYPLLNNHNKMLSITLEDINPIEIQNINTNFKNTCIFLDLGYLSNHRGQSMQQELSILQNLDNTIEIILFGHCVPMSAPQNIVNNSYSITRLSKLYFDMALQMFPDKKFYYSDLTTSYIETVTGGGGHTPVQLKYTLGDQIHVYKNGHIQDTDVTLDQISDVAKKIIEDLYPRYNMSFNPNFSWSDRCINDVYEKLPGTTSGNATSWVAWNVNRHITYVITQEL